MTITQTTPVIGATRSSAGGSFGVSSGLGGGWSEGGGGSCAISRAEPMNSAMRVSRMRIGGDLSRRFLSASEPFPEGWAGWIKIDRHFRQDVQALVRLGMLSRVILATLLSSGLHSFYQTLGSQTSERETDHRPIENEDIATRPAHSIECREALEQA